MRCRSCDNALTVRESKRRVASTGEFLDLCESCYVSIKTEVKTFFLNEEMDEDPLDQEDEL